MIVFLVCSFGIWHDGRAPAPIKAQLRGVGGSATICFQCGHWRRCVVASDTNQIRAGLSVCGAGETLHETLVPGESYYVKSTEDGEVAIESFPAALSLALGLKVRPAELGPRGWRLVPGVGRVLSRRIAIWQKEQSGGGRGGAPCNIEAVPGVGPVKAQKIRRFLGLASDC